MLVKLHWGHKIHIRVYCNTSGFLWGRRRGCACTLGACTIRNFTYLVIGPWLQVNTNFWMYHIYWKYRYCSDIKFNGVQVAKQRCINVFIIKSRGWILVFAWNKVTKHWHPLCISSFLKTYFSAIVWRQITNWIYCIHNIWFCNAVEMICL